MTPILQAATELQDFLLSKEWAFCIIGGIAVLRWGKPRTTQDVDVSLFVEFGEESNVVNEVLNEFQPRIKDAHQFAMESRVILARSAHGIDLDIVLSQFEFEKSIIERASYFEFEPGLTLLTISAEDLIVLKAFAGREQDWNDVRGILVANDALDLEITRDQLTRLSELSPETSPVDKFEVLIAELKK